MFYTIHRAPSPRLVAAGRSGISLHLFLDQDGIPTLVEVKRSTDSRIRREVVGQMLDYAAKAVMFWPVEEIRARFVARHATQDEADEELSQFLAAENFDPDAFWIRVKTNLQAGRIRMIFVADAVPTELKRVVEFLNEQMDPAEVLALELRQYVGEGLKTLVPWVIGNTAGAVIKKGAGSPTKKQWDERSFLDSIDARDEPNVGSVVHAILGWTSETAIQYSGGKAENGDFQGKVTTHSGAENNLFCMWMDEKTVFLELPLGYFTPGCKLSDFRCGRLFSEE